MRAYDDDHGWELWSTDGSAQGTGLVKDIFPNNLNNTNNKSSRPAFLTNVNGTLFFTADDSIHGRELWKSDGTEQGTVMVRDIYPGVSLYHDFDPGDLNSIGDRLYFTADDGRHGREVWTSDGTVNGTKMLKDIFPGANKSSQLDPRGIDPKDYIRRFVELNGKVLFTAAHQMPEFRLNRDFELWSTDGTVEGTQQVVDIAPGSDGSYPYRLTVIEGTLFFSATNFTEPDDGTTPQRQQGLWRSDGTEKGTSLIKVFSDTRNNNFRFGDILEPVGHNGLIYFSARTEETGQELWQSDGTPEGTVLVQDILPGIGTNPFRFWESSAKGSFPSDLTSIGDTLYFTAYEESHGRELWKLEVPAPVAGDTDRDGDFDTDDILNIKSAGKFNQGFSGALWSEGDFDGDGDVDAHDIIMMQIAAQGEFPVTFDSQD